MTSSALSGSWFRSSILGLGLALSALAACTAAGDDKPGTGGGSAAGTGGARAGTGGATNPGSGGGTNPGSGGAGPAGTGGATSTGTGGSATGAGGGAATGTGGMTGGGTGGAATASGGRGGNGGQGGGATGSGGGGMPAACPANATFCSGFEAAGLPTGAQYFANAAPGEWTRDFAIDMTIKNTGTGSMRVKLNTEAGTSGSTYKMLAVPAPNATFWVRFYMRSDVDLGNTEHDVFAMASGGPMPNDSPFVEFAEDVGIAFNASDVVRWPTGYGRITGGGTMPYVLAKDTWHCIELSFDSAARVQQLYVNGMQLINATNYPDTVSAPYRFFKFGYNPLHNIVRQVWYDDVVVAPQRIQCL